MKRFEEGGLAAFREWSFEINSQLIETLPPQTVKILEWDPGEYLRL